MMLIADLTRLYLSLTKVHNLRYIFNLMKKVPFSIILIYFVCASLLYGRSHSDFDARRSEFFGQATPLLLDKSDISAEPLETVKVDGFIKLMSVRKGKATDWSWKTNIPGGSEILTVDAKFKINDAGPQQIPIVKLLLFDGNGFYMSSVEEIFLVSPDNILLRDPTLHVFKGRKTYLVRFPVPPLLKYKRAVVVMGKNDDVSVMPMRSSTQLSDLKLPPEEYEICGFGSVSRQ
ncbi:MAG: hypothetical protein Q8Q33_06495 [Chlamydiota bacterium]|nr:hypothetical protein [Chlamydiota bacterium]